MTSHWVHGVLALVSIIKSIADWPLKLYGEVLKCIPKMHRLNSPPALVQVGLIREVNDRNNI